MLRLSRTAHYSKNNTRSSFLPSSPRTLPALAQTCIFGLPLPRSDFSDCRTRRAVRPAVIFQHRVASWRSTDFLILPPAFVCDLAGIRTKMLCCPAGRKLSPAGFVLALRHNQTSLKWNVIIFRQHRHRFDRSGAFVAANLTVAGFFDVITHLAAVKILPARDFPGNPTAMLGTLLIGFPNLSGVFFRHPLCQFCRILSCLFSCCFHGTPQSIT